jgi:hypothetical protein
MVNTISSTYEAGRTEAGTGDLDGDSGRLNIVDVHNDVCRCGFLVGIRMIVSEIDFSVFEKIFSFCGHQISVCTAREILAGCALICCVHCEGSYGRNWCYDLRSWFCGPLAFFVCLCKTCESGWAIRCWVRSVVLSDLMIGKVTNEMPNKCEPDL